MRALLLLALALLAAGAQAASPWDKDRKESFRDRCEIEARKQPLVADRRAYCACYSDALEARFGKEHYPAVTRTKPDPHGTPMAQAMAQAAMGCVMAGGYSDGYPR